MNDTARQAFALKRTACSKDAPCVLLVPLPLAYIQLRQLTDGYSETRVKREGGPCMCMDDAKDLQAWVPIKIPYSEEIRICDIEVRNQFQRYLRHRYL